MENKWDKLSMRQRADLIKLFVKNGVTSLDDMRQQYNSFQDGGPTDPPKKVLKINSAGIPEQTLPEVEVTDWASKDFSDFSPYNDYLNNPRKLRRDYLRGVREYLGIPEAIVARVTDSFNENYYTGENKEILKSLENASGFFNEYLNSPFYKEKTSEYGVDPNNMQYDFPRLRVTQTNITGPGHEHRKLGKNIIYMPLHYRCDENTNIDNQQDEILVHELAHENPLFNNGNKWITTVESPYYGNNYSGVPEAWKKALAPEDWWELSLHDQELNESYSDLQALRYLLYKEGIWNVLDHDKPFGEKELDKLMHLDGYSIPVERFLMNHNTQQIINAINEIAQSEDTKEVLPMT